MTLDRNRLTIAILIAMGLGIVAGAGVHWAGNEGWVKVVITDGLFQVLGKVFLAALQLLVVPLVFVSLVCGSAALDDVRKVGRVGLKTLAFYLCTTAIAVSLAIGGALLVRPGAGFEIPAEINYEAPKAPSLVDMLIGLVPANPVKSMAEGNMIQLIVFSILFGLALVMSGDFGRRVLAVFRDLNEVVMKLVTLVMFIAPFGVFALIARTFATEGLAAVAPLAKYFGVVLGVLIVHGVVTYPALLTSLARLDPVRFFRNAWNAQLFAFSTASSNATLPVTLETAERRMGVGNPVASFTVPLGATINMDGTAIMQGVATVFIAQAFSVPLGLSEYAMIVLTATLASIGTAGVPGVGLVMLAMVLKQVGLPEAGIGLVLGVDRLLDMARTAVNVTGDLVVTCVVGRSEGQFDLAVFNADNPPSE